MNHLAQLIVFRPYRGTPRRRLLALALLALAMLALPVAALATPSVLGHAAPAPPASAVGSDLAAASPVGLVLDPDSPDQVTTEVAIRDDFFEPQTVTVTVGSAVRWTNQGQKVHSSTSDQGYWSWALLPGASFSVRFFSAGTFPYHCIYHPGMTGTVVVTTGQPTPPTPGPTPPTPGPTPSPIPTFTPGQGGPIIYSYFTDNTSVTKSDLFVLDPDTNQTQNVTNSPQLAEVQPSWAPDRGRVAYAASVVNTASDPWSIWVRDMTSGQAAPITTGPEQYEPDWHPSGGLIAFTSIGRVGGTTVSSEIAVVAPDGSGYRSILRLNSCSMGVVNPNWSPDGTRLAFSLSSSLLGGELYQVNADGSNAVPLYSHPGWDDIDPEWSPDGRYVAFSSGPNQGTVTRHDIWLLDTVTGIAGAVAQAPTWDLRRPAWSPDGTRLVFTARFQTQPVAWALYIAPATGGTVTGPLALGVEPDWAAGSLIPVPTPTPGATSGTPPPFPTLPSPEPTLPGPTATPPIIPTFPPPETPEPTPTPSTPEPTSTPLSPTPPLPTATAGTPGPVVSRLFLPLTFNGVGVR